MSRYLKQDEDPSATPMMPLLNEGTDTWRPLLVDPRGDGQFRLPDPQSYEEEWAFVPRSIVRANLIRSRMAKPDPFAAPLS